MAGTLNKVILIGNLGKDPEIKFLPDGGKIASFPLATSESWKDKVTGEKKERTEWHRVVVFNEKLAEIIEKFIRKGSKIYIEGQLQTRKWNDPSGAERYTTEVILSRFKGELVIMDAKKYDSDSFDMSADNMNSSSLDDDIPF